MTSTSASSEQIRLLAPTVVSQIAAGEVVERPRSALKELIENSLDAGATKIEIEVLEGGITSIKIKDNGNGIPFDELKNAVQPHMTSKLSKLAEIESIGTFGFRGEALAAISSITNLTLSSRTADSREGGKLELSGGWMGEEPVKHVMAQGTVVETRDMFFNTAARRKFLKKARTEWSHCDGAIRKQMIAHPQVEFHVSFGNAKGCARPLHLTPQNSTERSFALMGPTFAANAIMIDHAAGPLHISGHVDLSTHGSAHRQHFYVNGRAVNATLIKSAIKQALAEVSRLGVPPFVLFLSVPPSLIDVNAHPAKEEVRYKESNAVFSFVHAAISKALDRPVGVNPAIPLPRKSTPSRATGLRGPAPEAADDAQKFEGRLEPSVRNTLHSSPEGLAGRFRSGLARETVDPPPPSRSGQGELVNALREDDRSFPVMGRAIGMLHGLYLIAENDQGLILVDVHAAHERILFEELKEMHSNNREFQSLIEPIELDLDPVQLDAISSHRKALNEMGIEISNNEGVEQLVSVPSFLAGRVDDYSALISGCSQELADTGSVLEMPEIINKVLATTACHHAVRGSNPYKSKEELDGLLRKMEVTFRSGKCNHGRPVWRVIKAEVIDKFFERGR